jgi:hypothetical protein
MEEKLKAVKVKLLEWSCPDPNTLRLFFEKVPPFLLEYNAENAVDTVFTDFGYLEIILSGDYNYDKGSHILNQYLNDEDVFIEEGVVGIIDFWNGEYPDRYDWSSDFNVSFIKKKYIEIPLSRDDWKAKYTEMALNYSEIHHERWDKLQLKFLIFYQDIIEGMIQRFGTSEQAEHNKETLRRELARMREYIGKNAYSGEMVGRDNIFATNKKDINNLQQKINSHIFNFWEKLKSIWERKND